MTYFQIKQLVLSLVSLPTPIIMIYLLSFLPSLKSHQNLIRNFVFFILLLSCLSISSDLLKIPLTKTSSFYNESDNIQAVVVLTGGIYKSNNGEWYPSRVTIERVSLANKLAEYKNVPLIISGGVTKPKGPPESLIASNFLKIKNPILDTTSKNTFESGQNILKVMNIDSTIPILLVTDPLHSLRSRLVMNKIGLKTVVYYRNNINEENYINWIAFTPGLYGIAEINKIIYECLALIYYLITNKI